MTTMTREPGEIARQLVYIGGCIRMKFLKYIFVFLQWYRSVQERKRDIALSTLEETQCAYNRDADSNSKKKRDQRIDTP